MYEAGDVLKYNVTWRAGAHYSFRFFCVTHITPKGTTMGRYMSAERACEYYDHDVSRERWRVGAPTGRVRRLPHPTLWNRVEPGEIEEGVVATSCVY